MDSCLQHVVDYPRAALDWAPVQQPSYGPRTARSSCTAITLLLLPRGLEASCSNTILSDLRDGAHGSGKQNRPGAPRPFTGVGHVSRTRGEGWTPNLTGLYCQRCPPSGRWCLALFNGTPAKPAWIMAWMLIRLFPQRSVVYVGQRRFIR